MNASNHRRRRGGFTLIEVLLVLVILVILGSLAIGTFSNVRRKALMDSAKAQIGILKGKVQLYETGVGSLPPSLDALVMCPDGVNPQNWAGPYLEKIPIDPWQNPYLYQYQGDQFQISSGGPDGQPETGDDVFNE